MAKVQFRTKIETVYHMDKSVAYMRVKVPAIGSNHVDRDKLHGTKFGPYSNSNILPAILRRAVRDSGIGEHIRLDRKPDNVEVEIKRGFFAEVTIEIGG